MTERPTWSPEEVDLTRPSMARVYDFYLGGSHNFEADREFGRQALQAHPGLDVVAQENRTFLRRVVRHACVEGIEQFLDLGSGIPSAGNVHEIAHETTPRARVVYVDIDPIAVAHGQALLAAEPGATALDADLRSPEAVLRAATGTGLLDLTRPLAVLMVAVLHFVHDDAAGLVRRYLRAVAPGSLLAVSHASGDAPSLAGLAQVHDRPDSPSRLRLRSRTEITAMFDELELTDPGVVALPRWRPELTGDRPGDADDATYPNLGGVGRRR